MSLNETTPDLPLSFKYAMTVETKELSLGANGEISQVVSGCVRRYLCEVELRRGIIFFYKIMNLHRGFRETRGKWCINRIIV